MSKGAPAVPRTYSEWRHCITVLCGIPLTLPYIETRIATLADPLDHGTQRFVAVWGANHLQHVRAWFERALHESATGSHS